MYEKVGVNEFVGESQAPFRDGSRLFSRLTLHRPLGTGEFGVVWLAQDDRTQELAALKLVPEAIRRDPRALRELKRVAGQSLLLRHPNIVRLLDFVEDERSAAIVMEYVDGSSLSDVRAEKRAKCFAVSELAPWVTSLCDALAYAHDSVGVIHGNLKPSNLMVNKGFELKVTGFGVAGSRSDVLSDLMAPACGRINYMSPQQLAGGEPSISDDIYAVGATLFELLSSQSPFFGQDVPAQVGQVTPPSVAERREHLGIAGEAVPRHWEETIAACLAKDPEERPQSLVELARRLRLGGTIRLSAATQESKMRALLQALAQARVVGSAAGVAALIAAAVIAVRSSGHVSAIRETANKTMPEAFATEVLRPDPVQKGQPDPQISPNESASVSPIPRRSDEKKR